MIFKHVSLFLSRCIETKIAQYAPSAIKYVTIILFSYFMTNDIISHVQAG